MFRARAAAIHADRDPMWRIGFAPEFRAGREAQLADWILRFINEQTPPGAPAIDTLVDIGSGASDFTDQLTLACQRRGIGHLVVDSAEMLAHLLPRPGRQTVQGRFPEVLDDVFELLGSAPAVLAYSVIQYVHRDMGLEAFIDATVELLKPGGLALIGDIPNRDQRDRQLAAAGMTIPEPQLGIDVRDVDLLLQVARLRSRGLHAYLAPQHPCEAMRLHRENMLIVRPAPYPKERIDGK